MNEPFGGDIIVKVDLSDYAARADIKNISHVDKSNLASQSKNQLRQNITFTCWRKKKKKLQTFGSIYFRDKSHFEEGGTQNYSVFQPVYRYFKSVVNSDYILE